MAKEPSIKDKVAGAVREVGEAASGAARRTADAVVGTAVAATGAGMTADQERIVHKAGLSGGAIPYFDKKSEQYPLLNQTFKGLEQEMANNPKYDTFLRQLGTRFGAEAAANRNDITKPTIMDVIARDIGTNQAMATRLEAAIRKNPDAVASKIAGYQQGQLASVLAEVEGVAPSPVAAAAPASATPSGAAAPAARPARTASPAATAKPAGPTGTATPPPAPPSGASAPAQTGQQQQPGPAGAGSPPPAQAAASQPSGVDPMKSIIDGFITNDNELLKNNVNNTLNPRVVVAIAEMMSDQAKTKFGVEAQTADAFAKKIKDNPQLAKQIEDNLKRNPEFVRELALASKNQGQPPAALRAAGKTIMDAVMANPEKLADDAYVKDLTRKMQAGREAQENGMGAAFSGLFDKLKSGDFKGFFSQIGDMIMGFFNKFMGGSGMSMSSNGGSFLDRITGIFSGFGRQDGAGRLGPHDMTTYPPGGQRFVEKPVMGADGKPEMGQDGKPKVTQVANTVQIPTTVTKNNGTTETKMVDVIPAVGNILATQLPGKYGNDGQYQRGNWSVIVVTNINPDGTPKSYKAVEMNQTQFDEYQRRLETASGRRLPTEEYTEADAIAKRERDFANGVGNTQYDPATGQVRVSAGGGRVYNEGGDPRARQQQAGRDPDRDMRPEYGSA